MSFYDTGNFSSKSQFEAQVKHMKIETNSCFSCRSAKQVVRKAMVSAVDEAVGKIIDILEATGFF